MYHLSLYQHPLFLLLLFSGEFHLRLRHLEKSLLQALNDAKGRILDDDRIIGTLEKLKQEAAEITRKVEETDAVMAEVEAVSDQYGPLSHYCSSIYFTLEGLNMVSLQTRNSSDHHGISPYNVNAC